MKTSLTYLILFITTNTLFAQSASLPYYTGFDSPTEQAGWQQFRKGTISAFDWVDNGDIFHDYNVGGSATDTVIDWYVSPPLNLTSASVMTMKMYAGGFSAPTPDNCEVWFGTDDPDPAIGSFVLLGNLSVILPLYQWLDTLINIPFMSDSGYVAFKYTTIGAEWMIYSFDSITISADVGINQIDNLNYSTGSIAPNPVISSSTVYFDSEIRNGHLDVYNIYGQKVRSIPNINGHEFEIHRNDLPIGTYVLNLTQGNKLISSEKFIISDRN
ncbi:MAG: hypothetical protein ACI9J3_002174 [Parvicellaceae bacterium]|jgi:hypothetical protein